MRILGLDIGSTSIKAVEMDTAFGRFEIHEYHEVQVPAGHAAVEAAGAFIQTLPKTPDRIVTTIRSNRVTFRNLTLPTRDKKAVQASISFELEDDLPFEAGDAAFDSVTLGHTGQETHVHVAAARAKILQEQISALVSVGVDPDVYTSEASAYRALLHKIGGEAEIEKPVMLLQLGHEHSTVYIHWKGSPVLCRDISWGGREFTLALSRKYGLSVDAAEKTKIDNGFVLPVSRWNSVSVEQKEFASTLFSAMADLFRDLRQADLSCKSVTQERVGQVFLAGGTSLLPGLAGLLTEELKIPVQPLRALSTMGGSGVTYSDQTDAKFALAAASAIALVSSERPLTVNFRKGQYSKTGKATEIDLSLLKAPLKTLGIASAVILVILGIESTLYDQKLNDANTQLEKSVKSFFGGVSTSALHTYLANTTSLKRNIEGELNKQRELVKLLGPNPNSPLDYLKDLSQSVPKDIVTDLLHYQVGSSTTEPYSSPETAQPPVSLSFTVASPQVAERLAPLIMARLKEAKRSSLEEVKEKDGTKVWKVTFTGKLQEGGSHGQ